MARTAHGGREGPRDQPDSPRVWDEHLRRAAGFQLNMMLSFPFFTQHKSAP